MLTRCIKAVFPDVCFFRGTSCSVCCWRPVAVRVPLWDLQVPTAFTWTRSKPHFFSWRVWTPRSRSVSRPRPLLPLLLRLVPSGRWAGHRQLADPQPSDSSDQTPVSGRDRAKSVRGGGSGSSSLRGRRPSPQRSVSDSGSEGHADSSFTSGLSPHATPDASSGTRRDSFGSGGSDGSLGSAGFFKVFFSH